MGLSLLWSQLGEGLEWGDSHPDSHCPSLLLWISGTLLASGPFATPRELKNLPWSQLLQAAVEPRGFSPRGTLGTGRIPCLQLGPVVLPRSHILIDVGPFLLGGT